MKNKKRKSKIEQSAERKTCDSIGPNEPVAEPHSDPDARTRAQAAATTRTAKEKANIADVHHINLSKTKQNK